MFENTFLDPDATPAEECAVAVRALRILEERK